MELLVIFAMALLVLGPKRLPDLASGLGKAIREFRKATRDLTDQIEVDDSVRKPIMELKAALRDEPPPWTPPRAVQPGTVAAAAPLTATPPPPVAEAAIAAVTANPPELPAATPAAATADSPVTKA